MNSNCLKKEKCCRWNVEQTMIWKVQKRDISYLGCTVMMKKNKVPLSYIR